MHSRVWNATMTPNAAHLQVQRVAGLARHRGCNGGLIHTSVILDDPSACRHAPVTSAAHVPRRYTRPPRTAWHPSWHTQQDGVQVPR